MEVEKEKEQIEEEEVVLQQEKRAEEVIDNLTFRNWFMGMEAGMETG